MNQSESWNDFPEDVCTLNTDQSVSEKHKCLPEQTLKILSVPYSAGSLAASELGSHVHTVFIVYLELFVVDR